MDSIVAMRFGFMRIGLSRKVTDILVDIQGIKGVTDPVDLCYKYIKYLIKAFRYPGWVVVNNSDAISYGCLPMFINPGVVVTICAVICLEVECYLIRHRACMSRAVTLD